MVQCVWFTCSNGGSHQAFDLSLTLDTKGGKGMLCNVGPGLIRLYLTNLSRNTHTLYRYIHVYIFIHMHTIAPSPSQSLPYAPTSKLAFPSKQHKATAGGAEGARSRKQEAGGGGGGGGGGKSDISRSNISCRNLSSSDMSSGSSNTQTN